MGKAYGILPTKLLRLSWPEYSLACRIFDIGCAVEGEINKRHIDQIKQERERGKRR